MVAEELAAWHEVASFAEQALSKDGVGEDFLRAGEGFAAQLAEIVHGERSPRDFDRQAMRGWLHFSFKARADLGLPRGTLPTSSAIDPARGPDEFQRFAEQTAQRLAVLLERRFALPSRGADDPILTVVGCTLGGGVLLGVNLCAEAGAMPLEEQADCERAREAFWRGYAGDRMLDVSLFLAAAALRFSAWELRRLEAEKGRETAHASWWEASEWIAAELGETGRARLEQLEAPYRKLAGEPPELPEVDGYPTPTLPILAVELPGREPGTPDYAGALEGSRYAAGQHFMIEAHKHALQLAAPGAFAELAEGERFFSAASLSILPDWHVAAHEMWVEASRAAQQTLAEIAPA